MEKLNFVVDPFCEKAFWTDGLSSTPEGSLTNPLCAMTDFKRFNPCDT